MVYVPVFITSVEQYAFLDCRVLFQQSEVTKRENTNQEYLFFLKAGITQSSVEGNAI